jgi:hypothetical protein
MIAPAVGAIGQRLVAQAMALLQQDQPLRVDIVGTHAECFWPRIVGRHREQKLIIEQPDGLDLDLRHRQRQHHDVERSPQQLFDQDLGLRFPQLQAQLRVALLQRRQNPRQHIGRERGDDPERQPSVEHAAAVTRQVDEIAGRREDALAALGHLEADLGQRDLPRAPLHQLHAEEPLQVADLHGQGGLRDRAGLGRPAEMGVLGQGSEISQLPQGDHCN